MNIDFMNNTIDNFLKNVDGKKLILFGMGDEMKRALPLFCHANNLIPSYGVDNDYQKWYSSIFGIKCYEPSRLLAEDDAVVLITSLFPYRVQEQLRTMNIERYFASVLFLEPVIGKRHFLVKF